MSRTTPGEVHRITNAPEPLGVEQSRRARRYLVQMGVRVACFLLAVLTWNIVPAVVSWILIVGAVVIPYIAVLLANAGREKVDVQQFGVPTAAIGPAPTRTEILDGRPDPR